MNTTPTPGAAAEWSTEEGRGRRLESEDMDSILVSRLDMLMHNSMTLRYPCQAEFYFYHNIHIVPVLV